MVREKSEGSEDFGGSGIFRGWSAGFLLFEKNCNFWQAFVCGDFAERGCLLGHGCVALIPSVSPLVYPERNAEIGRAHV